MIRSAKPIINWENHDTTLLLPPVIQKPFNRRRWIPSSIGSCFTIIPLGIKLLQKN